MEKFNFGYSIKNIPIPSEKSYKLELMDKIEAVVKKMRWKAIFSEENPDQEQTRKTYGLKTQNCPPPVKELAEFEKDLFDLPKKVKFRRVSCNFQSKLKEDIKTVKTSEKVYTPADKTSNIYKISKEEHRQLLSNAVTTTYKKANEKLAEKINKLGKKFADKKGVLERMDKNTTGSCFITLKDHKENFANNPKTRLINPAKNEIGRISKDILDNINTELRGILQLNQWKNTKDVITWFNGIQNKTRYKFVVFDIKEFYPSIKEALLVKALNFAKQHVRIKKEDYDTVMHARKSLLYCGSEPWIKKTGGIFDVTMGAYDGAEVCELVGIYLLSQLTRTFGKKDIGLYRDDGLAVFKDISGPEAEKIKKKIQKIFKDNDLQITISCNLKITNYLDVTLNLNDGSYKPYRKPDEETLYIHAKSNHPPNIIKQLPISVEDRLRNLSSSKEIFEEAAKHYQEALEKCGYSYKLRYERTSPEGRSVVQQPLPRTNNETRNQRPRNRPRNITYFNPPFSKSVSTNVAKYFLNLINKHFGSLPEHHKFRKLFNRQNLKVSYSCMPNVKCFVNGHNKKILAEEPRNDVGKCNCSNGVGCPMDGNCLSENTLYSGRISSNLPNYDPTKYLGLSEPQWKKRFHNHTLSFNDRNYAKCEIAKEVWRIKDQGGNYQIRWEIVGHAPGYNPITRKCRLCTAEKLLIAEDPDPRLLNKRDELVSKCRHRRKHALELC